jgi:hypothetical protein
MQAGLKLVAFGTRVHRVNFREATSEKPWKPLQRRHGSKALSALTREQRAAMIGRDGGMQVRQRFELASWTIWRLGVSY